LDVIGAVMGVITIRSGWIQFKETGKWFKWQNTNRTAVDVARQNDYPDAPPANEGKNSRIGGSKTQNADVNKWVKILKNLGADDIRVNQEQVNGQGIRVGQNRPDLQFTLGDKRFYIEWDTSSSSRGVAHAMRILANDPSAGNYIQVDGNGFLYNAADIINSILTGNRRVILITMD
jgi:hypothetical protein